MYRHARLLYTNHTQTLHTSHIISHIHISYLIYTYLCTPPHTHTTPTCMIYVYERSYTHTSNTHGYVPSTRRVSSYHISIHTTTCVSRVMCLTDHIICVSRVMCLTDHIIYLYTRPLPRDLQLLCCVYMVGGCGFVYRYMMASMMVSLYL